MGKTVRRSGSTASDDAAPRRPGVQSQHRRLPEPPPSEGCRHRLRVDDGWKSGPTSKPGRSVFAAACLAGTSIHEDRQSTVSWFETLYLVRKKRARGSKAGACV